MNFFNRRKLLKKANYLDLTPVKLAKYEVDEKEQVIIIVSKFRNPFWRNFLLPRRKSPEYRIRLDELGSATWNEINGRKKVGEICSSLSGRLGEKIHPAEERVTRYFTLLYDQRYISFREITNGDPPVAE
ncbi:MAG: PqqD family protein [Bacteroidia bacterium]|nr:PqqD family protein [Bacteroidia bacterium]